MGASVQVPDIARTVADLRARVRSWRADGATVALVPTMGALHEGHLALVQAAKARCDRTVVSIFVNPTQFGPTEDLASYPREESRDLAKLAAHEVELVFAPELAEMYGESFATTVSLTGVTEGLCGDFRPGHFAGVATVVSKLLLQCLPDVAFFGEKDYQQLLTIKRLVIDLDIPVEIAGVATVRDEDGLALSSRNFYLTPDQRQVALALNRTLFRLAESLSRGAAPLAETIEDARAALETAGFDRIDYLEVRDAETLAPVQEVVRPARALAAVHVGRTRLIDNVPVDPPPR